MEEREASPLSIAWDYREYLRALEKKDEMEEAFRWDLTQLEMKDTIKTKDRVQRRKDWVEFSAARKSVKELKERPSWQWAKKACQDRSDGYQWECRRAFDGKKHQVERSIGEDTCFEDGNLSLEETLQFTYWWTQGLKQYQIKQQLGLGPNTAGRLGHVLPQTLVGGEGKTVQIDESKIGKRKYHCGHMAEGQWVFSAIKEDSCKCSIVTMDNRKEETVTPVIRLIFVTLY